VLFGNKREKLLSDKRLLGRWGQQQCEKFLKRQGYKTLTRNYSCSSGEIDLIMTAGDGTVVFVEVKARADEKFADAEAAITAGKKQRMTKTANLFLRKYKLDNMPGRFDVVIVMADEKGKPQIRHYENAF
jgi:putative endonuclease